MAAIKHYCILTIVLLLTAGLAVSAAGLYVHEQLNKPLALDGAESFQIKQGGSVTSVANALEARGLISSALIYRLHARLCGSTVIRMGEYNLEPGDTIKTAHQKFVHGKTKQYSIQFIEGKTYKDMLSVLRGKTNIRQKLAATANDELLGKINPDTKFTHPEGLFYPDTYFYESNSTDVEILRSAHLKLLSVLAQEWEKRAPNLPYQNSYEALIMASIIEKETAVGAERPEIAGVFVRRLQKNMRLETDPTVIYGMGDKYKGNITRKDLRTKTAYNTYRMKGLPPTPIALVGREAIHAALHPAEGDALFFVAKGDGTHQFSATLAEHNKAVRKYQHKRRADYTSTPKKASDTDMPASKN